MNELQIFNNPQFGEIRTLTENGKTLFCGKDVAAALGYNEPHKAIARHCKGGTKRPIGVQTGTKADGSPATQQIEMLFIPEGDIYRLAARSELPGAEKFESWIFDEVLPTIRQTGGYIGNTDNLSPEELMAKALLVAQRTIEAQKEKLTAAAAENEANRPKVLFAESVAASKTTILVSELAKLLKQNGCDMGQNRLFKWLRENGYLIRRKGNDYNMPTQRAMERGLFEIKETTITHSDGHINISKTPKVTGKGQQYFADMFLGKH